jgi:hypothetical protein
MSKTGKRIELADDGTFDTVLRCSECGKEFRGTYAADDGSALEKVEAEVDYADWIEEFINEVEAEHVCNADEQEEE